MNTKILIGVVALLVVTGGAAGAFALGVIPGSSENTGSSGGNDGGGSEFGGGDDTATQTTESTVVVDDSGTASGTGTADQTQQPFSFTIDKIEKCGQRCRNVTATISNNQDSTATGVTVRSEIYTGDNYNNQIWKGSSEAGELASDQSYTDKKQVNLGYTEAYAVQQNDGKILIKTFVTTDDGTYVFKEKRDVL